MDTKNYFYIEIKNEKDIEQAIENIRKDYKSVVEDTKKFGKKKYRPEYVDKLRIKLKWRVETWLGQEDIENTQKKQRDEDYL